MDKEQQIDYQAREIARYCLDSPDSNFRKSVFIGKERRSIPGEIMNFVDRDKARLCGLALNERYNFNIKGLNLKDIVLSLICIHENVEELGYLDRIYAEATDYFLKARTILSFQLTEPVYKGFHFFLGEYLFVFLFHQKAG